MHTLRGRPHASWTAVLKILGTIFAIGALLVCTLLGIIIFGVVTERFKALTVLSGSMEPAIPRGSLIITTPLPIADVKEGDIITFHLPNDPSFLETHRVHKITMSNSERLFETKGDANLAPDPWNLKLLSEPAWKVSVVMPGVGSLFGWVRSSILSLGIALVIPLVLGLIWVYEIWRPTSKKIARS